MPYQSPPLSERSTRSLVFKTIDAHFDLFVADLQNFCRIRSRRREPDQMVAAAEFVKQRLETLGARVELIEADASFPYVLGELDGGPPTLLNYNHYDVEVQPSGEDSDWISGPYEARVRDGAVYARGVADNKAALMSRIHAVRAIQLAGMKCPVGVKFVIEGKKELHSPDLAGFFAAQGSRLSTDAVLWENSTLDRDGRPLLRLGEKGLLYVRLDVVELRGEVSSQYAPVLRSATASLVRVLSSIVGPGERCLLPGFYDGVRQAEPEEVALMRAIPVDVVHLARRAGISPDAMGTGAELSIRLRSEPSVLIAGVTGGSVAEPYILGLAASASATLEFRLVPGQEPSAVLASLRECLSSQEEQGVVLTVLGSSRPARTDFDSPFVRLVARTARDVYGLEPLLDPLAPVIGGQGACPLEPIVGLGVGRSTANADGPNEHVRLEDYRNSIRHVVSIILAMADGGG